MNTLTGLIPSLYRALNVVSRELVGFIPAVTRDASVDRAAVGQAVKVPIVPAQAARDITPSNVPPNDGDQTITTRDITITKSRAVPFKWNGEEVKGLNNNGPGYDQLAVDQIAQAMRTLTNEMEADLAAAAALGSRAYGTVGTIPFTTDTGEAAQLRKILDDNGAPLSDRHLVIDTTTGAQFRTKHAKVDEVGTQDILTQGRLINLAGFDVRESAGIITPSAGNASSATVNNAGYAVGATVLTLSSAGTGAILAGDIVTFAGDTNKYLVVSGDADVSGGGTITIAEPGLRVAMSAATKLITVVAAAPRMAAFRRNAVVLAQRLPALAPGGDGADDSTTIVDPVSGLTFEVRTYGQYRQRLWEIGAAWGTANIKPEHTATLIR